MKNIIVIICDSLIYDEDFFDKMPRLSKYRENITVFENYFAQAPFTDAAVIPIFTGSNVLDYSGYFNNLKNKPYNINEIFKEMGYVTYNTLWIYPNTLSFLRGVDNYHYMDGALMTPINRYRFKYFQNLSENKAITKAHMEMLEELLDDFFEMSKIFCYDLKHNNYKFDLLNKYTNFNAIDVDGFILQEEINRNKYLNDKEMYIGSILSGENSFFKNTRYPIRYSTTFNNNLSKIRKRTKRNIIKQLGYSFCDGLNNRFFITFNNMVKNYKNKNKTINSFKSWLSNIIKFGTKYDTTFLSAKVIFDEVSKYLYSKRSQKNFVITHINDNHSPLNFFSKEIDDIEKEINDFHTLSKKSFKDGNIFYKLSMNYVDNQICDFIDNLERKLLLEETIIIITADHGSSYVGNIFRDEITTTFFDENYKIPFLIFDKKTVGKTISNVGIATQFIPTLLDYLNVSNHQEWIRNESILRNSKKELIFEYYGPGCPDYIKRDKLFCVRNGKYKIGYKVGPNQKNNEGEIVFIYNIAIDPKEKKDIKHQLKNDQEVAILVGKIKSQ